jgi:Ca2+-binding EF-hand superfamily protein
VLVDLQVRKLTHMFETIDEDGNGALEQDDYERLADRVADIRGWDRGSPEHAEVRSQFVAQWSGLKASADSDASSRVTLDEWLRYQDRLISDPEYFDALVGGTVDFFFDFMDDDQDGRISCRELAKSFVVFGVESAEADLAFPHLDIDNDGYLSKSEYHQIVLDFFGSADPDAPGNWMLGAVTAP